jgi:hypothetical protein
VETVRRKEMVPDWDREVFLNSICSMPTVANALPRFSHLGQNCTNVLPSKPHPPGRVEFTRHEEDFILLGRLISTETTVMARATHR